MNAPAISVEELSKRYRLGGNLARRNRGGALEHGSARRWRGLLNAFRKPAFDVIWALKDIGFEVAPGEVVGLVGRNGAGKSTLLKILSRVTEPTAGRAVIRGRVGSLLEVGTGFHPELTGRENIYLSGAILGMKRAEIERKFDEIVAFSEVERFLGTPVKRYSSGMYVRLAFAVAAHLEPEVLLVDEVLAVGDASFQKKCLGKMGDVAHEGRTVLFVSHNMIAVQNLCRRAIWLDEGRIRRDGPTKDVVGEYLSASFSSETDRTWSDPVSAPGNESVRLKRVSMRPEDGAPGDPITMSTPLRIDIEYWNQVRDQPLHVSLQFFTEQQVVAFATISNETDGVPPAGRSSRGVYRSTCRVPGDLLNSGTYRVMLLVHRDGARIAYRDDNALSFEVLELEQRRGTYYGREPGAVRPALEWRTEYLSELVPAATAAGAVHGR